MTMNSRGQNIVYLFIVFIYLCSSFTSSVYRFVCLLTLDGLSKKTNKSLIVWKVNLSWVTAKNMLPENPNTTIFTGTGLRVKHLLTTRLIGGAGSVRHGMAANMEALDWKHWPLCWILNFAPQQSRAETQRRGVTMVQGTGV